MGTAGHIDHGKTSLVKALTGIDTDRLVEEKKRGITIELGFAHLDLPGGERLGVVDMPGHERFVKNMVAGAAGIDFVLLVVAADEGVMPQTREHLEICTLLGIDTGLVALTKTDMVDEELLELVQEDVSEFLAGTFLEGAPVMPVSAHTGTGVEELQGALASMCRELKPKRRSDLFRLPIDRVFTMKGHGTVVTGTLIAGDVKAGDEVRLYPEGADGPDVKIRGVQSHGSASDAAQAGQRTALNLAGVEVDGVSRGQILARPGSLFPSSVWDVELRLLSSSPRGLKHRKEIHFHHGSREVLARVHLLDRDELKPGERCVCQVRFEAPLAGVYGDRVVLRSFSPLRTIGGGAIVNPLGRQIANRSARNAELRERQLELLEILATGESQDVLLAQLELARAEGLTFAQLTTMTDLESKGLDKLLGQLGGQQKAVLFDKEARAYVSGTVLDGLCASAVDFMAAFHAKQPMKPGLSRSELASDWGRTLSPKLLHTLVERLLKTKKLAADQDVLRLPDHEVSLAGDEAELKAGLLAAYTRGGLTPPNLKDVLEELKATPKAAMPVFKLLIDEGRLLKIKEDMYFAAQAVDGLKATLYDYFSRNEELGPQDFKELTNLSRKYSIPLLEWLDKEKITVRVGDKRRLRKRQEA